MGFLFPHAHTMEAQVCGEWTRLERDYAYLSLIRFMAVQESISKRNHSRQMQNK